jgi:hypothetical protein
MSEAKTKVAETKVEAVAIPETDDKRADKIEALCNEFASNDSQRRAIEQAANEGMKPDAFVEKFTTNSTSANRKRYVKAQYEKAVS